MIKYNVTLYILTILFTRRWASCPLSICLAISTLQSHYMIPMLTCVGGTSSKQTSTWSNTSQWNLFWFRTFSIYTSTKIIGWVFEPIKSNFTNILVCIRHISSQPNKLLYLWQIFKIDQKGILLMNSDLENVKRFRNYKKNSRRNAWTAI